MKIVSYNVNGIRAAIKKGLLDWLSVENPDVFCVQETKAQSDQVDQSLFLELGYQHNYWFSAQKKGYSGVAIFSKTKPNHIEFGTGIQTMDFEGRNLRLDFDTFSVMSLYLPSGTNLDRLEFKLNYMEEFLVYIKELVKKIPNLIVCGDFNICHTEIDIHNPKQNKNTSGFLPVERAWFTRFLELGFVDSFREFNTDPHNYSWWSYRANSRNNNKGWRLDYHLANQSLKDRFISASILSDAKHSDHCPVLLEIEN